MTSEGQGQVAAANEILGLQQGARVTLKRTMADIIFQTLSTQDPKAGAVLLALDGQAGTVTTADDNLVLVRLEKPANVGTTVYEDVAVKLMRSPDGVFEFSVSGSSRDAAPLSFEIKDLRASSQGGRFVLASTEPRLRFTPASATTGAEIEAYTGPFLSKVPAMLRAFAPETVGLLSLTAVA